MQELKKYLIKPLVMIGALNWGLIGMFRYDLIAAIFQNEMIVRLIYSAIGIAALACIAMMLAGKNEYPSICAVAPAPL